LLTDVFSSNNATKLQKPTIGSIIQQIIFFTSFATPNSPILMQHIPSKMKHPTIFKLNMLAFKIYAVIFNNIFFIFT
jgi:hypothetical protein